MTEVKSQESHITLIVCLIVIFLNIIHYLETHCT
uniref:Uncharacterized protein n=1 Tax=Anguilla anguilla TaxID=7936 RepID=A0A0E9RCV7_ANGAN